MRNYQQKYQNSLSERNLKYNYSIGLKNFVKYEI